MKSQWDCIRANLGEWHGSFTSFSPDGEMQKDTPSVLVLADQPDGSIQLVLTRTPKGEPPNEMIRSFTAPGPGPLVPFFETGAFCQGSTFWSSQSRNGAELALTTPERRVRLVLLYAGSGGRSQLSDITLIRESKAGSGAVESAPLTVEQLLGTWEGESVSLFPDGRELTGIRSRLTLERVGDRLQQSLSLSLGSGLGGSPGGSPGGSLGDTGGDRTLTSTARIEGNKLLFESGPFPIQVLLLPGGASANGPLEFPAGEAFFLEVGWMVAPGDRQRLMRRYDGQGNCESVTLTRERQIS